MSGIVFLDNIEAPTTFVFFKRIVIIGVMGILQLGCSQPKDPNNISFSTELSKEHVMNLSLTSTKLPFNEKELTEKLLTTIDLPLESLNRANVEKIFGVKLDIINPESKVWGLPNADTWYTNVDDESVPLQKRQFGFGFDLGHSPNFKDVPLCIKPESIIGHLKSAGWQEHLEPGLPNRKPIVSYTKDNKRVHLNLVGKNQVERQITCVANLSVGAL